MINLREKALRVVLRELLGQVEQAKAAGVYPDSPSMDSAVAEAHMTLTNGADEETTAVREPQSPPTSATGGAQ